MQSIRIIGGEFRSRQITFPDLAAVRPTSNRVRETLFNWLAPVIYQSYCLDLFAGSGALGFEALSRGAQQVVMVDKSQKIIHHLHKTVCALGLNKNQITLCQAHAPEHIVLSDIGLKKPFDIVFLDPPFYSHYIQTSCQWLKTHQLLHENSLVYLEMENTLTIESALSLPFNMIKQGKTSQTFYCLIRLL